MYKGLVNLPQIQQFSGFAISALNSCLKWLIAKYIAQYFTNQEQFVDRILLIFRNNEIWRGHYLLWRRKTENHWRPDSNKINFKINDMVEILIKVLNDYGTV